MSGQSTGETSLALARAYVMRLSNEGRLSAASRLTFSEFAKGWWQPACAYVWSQKDRGRTLSACYRATMRGHLLRATSRRSLMSAPITCAIMGVVPS
jgi:hypothetical protein